MAISLYHSGHKQMLLSSVLGTKYSLGQVCVGCTTQSNADYSKIREGLRVRHVHSGRERLSLSHETHRFHQKLTYVTSASVSPKYITACATPSTALEGWGNGNGNGCFSYFYLIKCPKWKQDIQINHLLSTRLLQQNNTSRPFV